MSIFIKVQGNDSLSSVAPVAREYFVQSMISVALNKVPLYTLKANLMPIIIPYFLYRTLHCRVN